MLLDCDFSRVPEGWRCSACGYLYRHASEQPPRRNCPRAVALQPAAERLGIRLSDIGHYAGALARWTLAGFPVRTDAEIERIERELCRPCDRYVAGRCAECGCRVNGSRLAVVNKVAMATERCPKGKW